MSHVGFDQEKDINPRPGGAWLLRSKDDVRRLVFVPGPYAHERPGQIYEAEKQLIDSLLAVRGKTLQPVARAASLESGASEDIRVMSASGTLAARLLVIAEPQTLDVLSLRLLLRSQPVVCPVFVLTAEALSVADPLALASARPDQRVTLTEVVANERPEFQSDALNYLEVMFSEPVGILKPIKFK